MKCLALAGVVFLAQDAGLRELMDRLEDDSIDVRTQAMAEIVRRGREALPALKGEHAKARGERRERLAEAIRAVGERDRLRNVLPPASRVTLKGKDRPLGEVLDALARQSRTPIEAGGVGRDQRVSVELAGVPFWKALDEVCKASGKVMYAVELDKVVLTAEPYAALPKAFSDGFAALVQRLELTTSAAFGAGNKQEQFLAAVQLCWEKGTSPSFLRLRLHELVDDKGTNLRDDGSQDFTLAAEGAPAAPSGLFHGFSVYAGRIPAPEAARLARFRFTVDCEFALDYTGVTFANPETAAGSVERCDKFTAHLQRCFRSGGTVRADLAFPRSTGVPALFPTQAIRFKDRDGREYPAEFQGSSADDTSIVYILQGNVPEKVVLTELSIKVPNRLHVERIEADLRDVPLK